MRKRGTRVAESFFDGVSHALRSVPPCEFGGQIDEERRPGAISCAQSAVAHRPGTSSAILSDVLDARSAVDLPQRKCTVFSIIVVE